MGALNTLLSYAAIRVCTDLAFWLLQQPEHLVAAGLAGAIGHLAKPVVKWALGGVLGALTLRALRRAGFFAYLAERR